MKKILVVVMAVMLSFPVVSVAQKLGHINSQELLSLMPESKAAQEKLKAKGQEIEYAQAMEAKTLTAEAQKAKEESLQAMQGKIKAYQEQAQKDMEKMQGDLINPILEKANKAIQDVGTKNGFTYIFDTSARSIVFVSPTSENVLPLVKKELGI